MYYELTLMQNKIFYISKRKKKFSVVLLDIHKYENFVNAFP